MTDFDKELEAALQQSEKAAQKRVDDKLSKGPADPEYRRRVISLLDRIIEKQASKPVRRRTIRLTGVGGPRRTYRMVGGNYQSIQVEFPPKGLGPVIELLKVLLKMRCDSDDVAQKLVASSADLEAIAADDAADVPALKGWRREIFGEDALALKHGRIALTVDGKKLRVVEAEDAEAEGRKKPAA